MSRLLVKHLVSKRCTEMTIVNRSAGRVEELAADFPEYAVRNRGFGGSTFYDLLAHGSIFLKCSPSGLDTNDVTAISSPKERQKASKD